MMKAKESPQVKKARKKLLEQMAHENKHITTQALANIRKAIHGWIARYSHERIDLKEKEITIFDENRNPAEVQNRFILNLLKQLKHNQTPKIRSSKQLSGRMKSS